MSANSLQCAAYLTAWRRHDTAKHSSHGRPGRPGRPMGMKTMHQRHSDLNHHGCAKSSLPILLSSGRQLAIKKTSKSKTKQTKSKFMQVTEANYVCQEPHLPHTKPRIAVQPGLSVCIACNFSAHSGQKLQLNFGPKGLSAILALALQSAVALEILRRVCTPLA